MGRAEKEDGVYCDVVLLLLESRAGMPGARKEEVWRSRDGAWRTMDGAWRTMEGAWRTMEGAARLRVLLGGQVVREQGSEGGARGEAGLWAGRVRRRSKVKEPEWGSREAERAQGVGWKALPLCVMFRCKATAQGGTSLCVYQAMAGGATCCRMFCVL